MASYEESLASVMAMNREMVESAQSAIEWGLANNAPPEWIAHWQEQATDFMLFQEQLMDDYFELLGDELRTQ